MYQNYPDSLFSRLIWKKDCIFCLFSDVAVIHSDTVMHKLGHPCHQVLQHIGLVPAPRLFELLYQLAGAGSRCYLVDLLLNDGTEVFDRVETGLLPGHTPRSQKSDRCWRHHCWVFWAVCGGAPSCMKMARLVSVIRARFRTPPVSAVRWMASRQSLARMFSG